MLLFVAALLYSSVGHGGGSGYLAVMALVGVSAAVMKPTALALNICVALIGSIKFYRVGAFSWSLFWPLAVTAVPMAFVGGTLSLPSHLYKPLVGVVLIYSAWRSFATAQKSAALKLTAPSKPLLLMVGGGLGFLSGITGVGGGIFLSPLLLLLGWAPIRVISGVSAVFILVNSIAGLLGVAFVGIEMHPSLPLWILLVVAGGWIGAEFGSKRLGNSSIQKLLAVVLVVAGIKMIATA